MADEQKHLETVLEHQKRTGHGCIRSVYCEDGNDSDFDHYECLTCGAKFKEYNVRGASRISERTRRIREQQSGLKNLTPEQIHNIVADKLRITTALEQLTELEKEIRRWARAHERTISGATLATMLRMADRIRSISQSLKGE